MTTIWTFLLLAAPFAVAGLLSWAADRAWQTHGLRADHDVFRADSRRVQHDTDAIRTRFERQPSWPSSKATGERR